MYIPCDKLDPTLLVPGVRSIKFPANLEPYVVQWGRGSYHSQVIDHEYTTDC